MKREPPASTTHRRSNIAAMLEAKKRTTGQELADQFAVSVRTIYRDIAELQPLHPEIAGFPKFGYQWIEQRKRA